MSDTDTGEYTGWAIVELMGHRRLAGWVDSAEMYGGKFLRLDVPGKTEPDDPPDWIATQYYNPSAIYCMTPTDEKTARAVARLSRPEPIHQWELPRLAESTVKDPELYDDDSDDLS